MTDRDDARPVDGHEPASPPVLLSTAVVGSYSVPDWLGRFKTDFHRGRLSAAGLKEIEAVAIKAAIVDQSLAGVDVISDGELARDNDMDYLLCAIGGIEIAGRRKRDFFDYVDAVVRPPLPERPSIETAGLLEELRFARSLTTKTLTTSLAGPFSLSRQVRREGPVPERELVLGLARATNLACKVLAAEGATHLQLDEPRLAGYPEQVELAMEAVNLVTEGVDAHVALHVCYGNRFARPAWEGHYDFLFPALEAANVDEIVLEFARKGCDDLQLFTRSSSTIKVGVGVVDVKSREIEPVEVVERRLHEALAVLPPDRIVVNPDCGLRHLPAHVAREKLVIMCEAARRVRDQVLGTSTSGGRRKRKAEGRAVAEERPVEVLAIGNAIVDLLREVALDVVGALGLAPGSMRLVERQDDAAFAEAVGWKEGISGGSAANTAVGLASLGRRTAFLGALGADPLGETFSADLAANGVTFVGVEADAAGAGARAEAVGNGEPTGTGRCLVLVTPDGERTMVTYLGAAAELRPDHLEEATFAAAGFVYLEGYLADAPAGYAVLQRAAGLAAAHGGQLALTLSDASCVQRHRELFLELAEEAHLVFANEEEALALTGAATLSGALTALSAPGQVRVVTRGARGAVVLCDGEALAVSAEAAGAVVDTTGAGDLFAAGFLAAWARGEHPRACAELGARAAGVIVTHLGARPRVRLESLLATTSPDSDAGKKEGA